MNFKKLKEYIRLSRPINVAITFVSIPIACWIGRIQHKDWALIFLAALTGALVTAGANAINDFFDIAIDKINRPERPLPRGALSKQDAVRMWFFTSLFAVSLNFFINYSALSIVILSIAILYSYSAKLKGTILAGNLVVGLMTAMAFIYGGAIVGTIERSIMPAMFAFFSNFSREIVKDVEDIEGDRTNGAVTLPVKYGIRPALIITTVSLTILVISTIITIASGIYTDAFSYIVSVADGLIIFSIVLMWQNQQPVEMRRVSNNLKIVMVIGLLSIIIGSIR